jgi:hypothetical protein
MRARNDVSAAVKESSLRFILCLPANSGWIRNSSSLLRFTPSWSYLRRSSFLRLRFPPRRRLFSTTTYSAKLLVPNSTRILISNTLRTLLMGECEFKCLHEFQECALLNVSRDYVDGWTAITQNLTFATSDTFILRADDRTALDPQGPGRRSVRLQSLEQYKNMVLMYASPYI